MDRTPGPADSCCSTQDPEVPRGFTRRLILGVNAVFLITMGVFLAASFQAERSQHYRETFEHLDETLGVLSTLPGVSASPTPDAIRTVENSLQKRTGVPHRVLTTLGGVISGSTEGELIGQEVDAVLDLRPFEGSDSGRAVLSLDGEEWLLSSLPLEDSEGGGQILLLRARSASEGFVAKFLTFHGVHVVLTVMAFVVLLKFLMDRYVRRPIEQLARHVQRVEIGEFQTAPWISGEDELAWLAQRFTAMGTKLKATVEQLVRSEKYSSVNAVTFRMARELKPPLERMKRHIVELESVAQQQPDLRRLASQMRADREKLLEIIRHLREIEPPEGV